MEAHGNRIDRRQQLMHALWQMAVMGSANIEFPEDKNSCVAAWEKSFDKPYEKREARDLFNGTPSTFLQAALVLKVTVRTLDFRLDEIVPVEWLVDGQVVLWHADGTRKLADPTSIDLASKLVSLPFVENMSAQFDEIFQSVPPPPLPPAGWHQHWHQHQHQQRRQVRKWTWSAFSLALGARRPPGRREEPERM